MKVAVYLSPQNQQPSSNHEKNIRHTSIEAYSTKYLISTPQNCQVRQRNCHRRHDKYKVEGILEQKIRGKLIISK